MSLPRGMKRHTTRPKDDELFSSNCFIALLTFHRSSGANPTLDIGTVNEKCI